MISDFIARLQEATGPDRKLDVEIHVLVVDFSTDHLWDVIEQIGVKGAAGRRALTSGRFTRSPSMPRSRCCHPRPRGL